MEFLCSHATKIWLFYRPLFKIKTSSPLDPTASPMCYYGCRFIHTQLSTQLCQFLGTRFPRSEKASHNLPCFLTTKVLTPRVPKYPNTRVPNFLVPKYPINRVPNMLPSSLI